MMNKSNSITQQSSLALPTASSMDRGPERRLIVLVPEFEVDPVLSARRIRELAGAVDGHVQLLGLSSDAAHEPGLRRQLIALSAMVADAQISVESKVEVGSNWLHAVRSEWHQGDVIACFAEQRLGFPGRPLCQILESNLNATVYVLTGVHHQEKRPRAARISEALAWAGSIGIILGFFWLQLKLTQFPEDWAYVSLLYVSIFAEAGMIWFWNSLFR
jgi:hypothetical protein